MQAKPAVGHIGDRYEREADRVAEQVVSARVPTSMGGISDAGTGRVQRQATAPPRGDASTAAPRQGGEPLPASVRADLEPRFDYDFGQVRIHRSADDGEDAHALSARAYTAGHHIVFGRGEYAPQTVTGRRLLAHELTHVVQQSGGSRGPVGVSADGSGAIRRQERGEGAAETEATMSREEEIAASQSSPGQYAVGTHPLRISLYNYAVSGHRLKPEHLPVVDEIRSMIDLARSGSLTVLIVGHASAPGSEPANLALSRRRARAVRAALGSVGDTPVREADPPPPILVGFAGEAQPEATNETVEGRSRNRRVDIYLLPAPAPRRREPEPTERPPERPPEDTEDDTDFFCITHPLICAAIGAGAALLLYCLRNPTSCLPSLPGGEEEEREPRACPTAVDLPSGTHRARVMTIGNRTLMQWPFNMRLSFRDDDSGCRCNCGEYLQEVRGFAERDGGTGTLTRERVHLVGGVMDPGTYREDARAGNPDLPYGHRYWDPIRVVPRPNQEEDSFLDDRESGCDYEGSDEPGMQSTTPGEQMRFRFEFRGAPVDGCHGRGRVGGWQEWVVWGETTTPQEEPPEPEPEPTPEPEPEPTPTPTPTPTPRITREPPSIGPAREPVQETIFCWNGAIACETQRFMQRQFNLTDDVLREAIEIEHRILRQHRPPAPPRVSLHGEAPVHRRYRLLREEARARVLSFARLEDMIPTDYLR